MWNRDVNLLYEEDNQIIQIPHNFTLFYSVICFIGWVFFIVQSNKPRVFNTVTNSALVSD